MAGIMSPYKGRFRVSQIYKGPAHKGIDLVGIDDKKIYSTVNGVVQRAARDTHPTGGMGLYIRIKDDQTGRLFYFAHLSRFLVKTGDRVTVGQPIGVEGSTGHSTGPHLHYEVRERTDNRTFVDVSKVSGIPNRLGLVEQAPPEMTLEQTKRIVQSATGYSVATMMFLGFYKYEKDLFIKAANAIKAARGNAPENITLAQAKKIVQEKTGYSDSTMAFLSAYKYEEDLFIKLAKTMI